MAGRAAFLPVSWCNDVFFAIGWSDTIVEFLIIFSFLTALFCAESYILRRLAFIFSRFLFIASHLLQNVVVQIATLTQLATDVQVALLLPGLNDAHAVLGVRELDRLMLLLIN